MTDIKESGLNSAVITLVFVLIAVVWGLWLIFKRDLMSADLLKVVSYFVGVVVTLMIVLWITTSFLPWWGDRLVVNTQLQNEQLVVISEVFYPQGWEAALDGNPVEILEVNGVLRGVLLPAGTHELVLEFNPADIRTGSILTWGSLILIVIMLAIGIVRKK